MTSPAGSLTDKSGALVNERIKYPGAQAQDSIKRRKAPPTNEIVGMNVSKSDEARNFDPVILASQS